MCEHGRRTAPAPAARGSLDPEDWAGLREQAHHMLDDMLGYIESLREFPVWQVIPDEVRAGFREPLPVQPTPLAQVHEEFMCTILPFAAQCPPRLMIE